MTTYQTLETIRLTATITNTAGTAVDPTTVTVTIENAQGVPVVEAESMTSSATGTYYYDYDIPSINNSRIGTYTFKVTATGEESRVTISKSSFLVDESI